MDLLKVDLLTVGTWLLAIAAIATLYFQHNEFITTLKADHKQRRFEAALQLWNDWAIEFDKKHRRSLLTFLKWVEIEIDTDVKQEWVSIFVQGGKVSRNSIKNAKTSNTMKELLCLSDVDDNLLVSDIEEMRTNLVSFLNVMEKVAVAYQYHIADQGILNATFKDIIVKFTTDLHVFIKEYRRCICAEAWTVLTDLVFHGEWAPKTKIKDSSKSADQT
jgi:hypothetical protein